MVTASEKRRAHQGPAVFSYGFRPFFLLGAGHAVVTVFVWVGILAAGWPTPRAFAPITWHAHEMIFGYVAAIIAGFILTAVPNWTGRLPMLGWPLATLVALWLAGRIVMYFGPVWWLSALVDAVFLFVLFGVILREIVVGRNWRNLPVCALIGLFACANVLFHAGALWWPAEEYATRLALAVIAVLIMLIGGRITPSFTRNWLAKRGGDARPVPPGRFDMAVVLVSGFALALWVAGLAAAVAGTLLLIAGALHCVRIARWRGWTTLAEPLVTILHIGYLWIPLSLGLMGASLLAPDIVGRSVALHALGAGAVGTMTLAVMTRATLGHTGRPLTAGPATIAIYALVTVGALMRLLGPISSFDVTVWLTGSAVLWGGAFLLFIVAYGPALVTRR